MADEDEPTEPDEDSDAAALDDAVLDEEELDDDALADDGNFETDDDAADDGDDGDDEDETDDDEEEDDAAPRTRRRAAGEEDEDDEDLLSPDDVEADLDRILKDRMVAADEDEDEEEDEDVGVDDTGERGEGTGRLQPKRADEQLCSSCFLLVRSTAPSCPVGDDDCPIFTS